MDIAIITCAWDRSTRLPHKNLLKLNGKPLIRHTVDFAKALGFPYYVFTPDDSIKDVCKDCAIIHEPDEMLDQDIMPQLRYMHKLIHAEYYILLQPTSPIRSGPLYARWIQTGFDRHIAFATSVYQNSLTYTVNGAFYWFNRAMVLEADNIRENYKYAHLWVDDQGVDIDTEKDFKKAVKYYADKNNS